jgi:hypothetical protein
MTKRILLISSLYLIALSGCQKEQENTQPAVEQTHSNEKADHQHKGHDHANMKKRVSQGSDADTIDKIVEAGCAMCIFKMKDVKKCELAVKIDGKPYLVEGATLMDHGDAHKEDGLCKTVRNAEVKGRIENGKFLPIKFKLLALK